MQKMIVLKQPNPYYTGNNIKNSNNEQNQHKNIYFKTGAGIIGDVNGDGGVNIFDLAIVASNFGKSLLAALATAAKIELSTDQKHHIATAIDQLAAKANRLPGEEMALNVLKAILPERLPTTQLLPNYPNPFNPEAWIPFQQHKIHQSPLKSMT